VNFRANFCPLIREGHEKSINEQLSTSRKTRTTSLANKRVTSDLRKLTSSENDTSLIEEVETSQHQKYLGISSGTKYLNSEKLSIQVREVSQLDRVTYFTNFKMGNDQKNDKIFLPNFNQIMGNLDIKYQHLKKFITFKKVKDIYPGTRFVYSGERVDNFEIVPGYFYPQALFVLFYLLNENRKILKRIFLKKIIDDSDSFSVNLFFGLKWTSIQIDDFLPLIKKSSFFSQANRKEAWPALLEKALAKICGNYFNASKINNLENLIRICTGFFTKKYFFGEVHKKNIGKMSEYLIFWKGILKVGHIILMKTKKKIYQKLENRVIFPES